MSDEGFILEEIAPYLKYDAKKGSFRVHMTDKHGVDSFDVVFGAGYCRQEG